MQRWQLALAFRSGRRYEMDLREDRRRDTGEKGQDLLQEAKQKKQMQKSQTKKEKEITMTELVYDASYKDFTEACLPKKFFGYGYCARCKRSFYLSIAEALLENAHKISLALNGDFKTNCPGCKNLFSVYPLIQPLPGAA